MSQPLARQPFKVDRSRWSTDHEDGAAPGLVGHGGEPVDAVHQRGAKERRRRACSGHLHRLNRGAALEA